MTGARLPGRRVNSPARQSELPSNTRLWRRPGAVLAPVSGLTVFPSSIVSVMSKQMLIGKGADKRCWPKPPSFSLDVEGEEMKARSLMQSLISFPSSTHQLHVVFYIEMFIVHVRLLDHVPYDISPILRL